MRLCTRSSFCGEKKRERVTRMFTFLKCLKWHLKVWRFCCTERGMQVKWTVKLQNEKQKLATEGIQTRLASFGNSHSVATRGMSI